MDSTFLRHTCVCWQQHITPLLYRLNTLARCTVLVAEVKGHSEWFRSSADARFLVAAADVQGSPVVPNHGVRTSETHMCELAAAAAYQHHGFIDYAHFRVAHAHAHVC